MAGLQYNFFPTDFFYPKPKPPAVDATRSLANLPVRTQKEDESLVRMIQEKEILIKAARKNKRINLDDEHHVHSKRYSKYLSPYPISWVLWIPEENSETT